MSRVVECLECGHRFKSSADRPRCSGCGSRRCRDVAPSAIELDEGDAARLEELRNEWDMPDSTNPELASELIRRAEASSISHEWEVDVGNPENVRVGDTRNSEKRERKGVDPVLLIVLLLIVIGVLLAFFG